MGTTSSNVAEISRLPINNYGWPLYDIIPLPPYVFYTIVWPLVSRIECFLPRCVVCCAFQLVNYGQLLAFKFHKTSYTKFLLITVHRCFREFQLLHREVPFAAVTQVIHCLAASTCQKLQPMGFPSLL